MDFWREPWWRFLEAHFRTHLDGWRVDNTAIALSDIAFVPEQIELANATRYSRVN